MIPNSNVATVAKTVDEARVTNDFFADSGDSSVPRSWRAWLRGLSVVILECYLGSSYFPSISFRESPLRNQPVNKQKLAKQLRAEAKQKHQQGDILAALRSLDRILELDVANAQDWYMTGALLCEVGEFAQAIGAFENCLRLEPQHVEAQYDLGRSLYKLGQADCAMDLLEQAVKSTDLTEMWMGLATIAPGIPRLDHVAVKRIRCRYAELVRLAEAPLLEPKQVPRRQDDAKQRIGYLSAHWHDANYMKPVWPLINAHDSDQCEIHLFDDSPTSNPNWEWLSNQSARIHSVTKLSNRQAAEAIQATEVDILVDLSAYSKPERMGVYVHRPAPIQAAWFNMYATSGFIEFDYIIGDRWVIRHEEQQYYSERMLQLPISYLTFRTNHAAPDVHIELSRTIDQFSFGCLGTQYKITPQVLDAWAAILTEAKQSRIILANRELKSLCNRQYLLDQFQSRGIAPQRVTILPPASHYEFLKYYDLIDLALDTFPYNGGTTTMEAIWQGVPVLTFSGDRWASRTSASILRNSHLTQFVVDDCEAYIRLAIEFATNSNRLDSLREMRRAMRDSLVASPACDSLHLAHEMESLYRSCEYPAN